MRVLVVEDDAALADAIRRGITDDGHAVDCAGDGASALMKVDINSYDAVVLDRDLPVVHGDDVCRQLLRRVDAPRILMLTASGDLSDRVDGLSLGADDYLSKPFAMVELLARLRALGRRSGRATPPILHWRDLTVDGARRQVSRAGRDIVLTRKEFGVLEVLTAADGNVVSAETLLEKVWDEFADPFTNAVRITMTTLRRKLGEPGLIETVTGVGYRMAV